MWSIPKLPHRAVWCSAVWTYTLIEQTIYQGSFCHVKAIANPFSWKSKAPSNFMQNCYLQGPWLKYPWFFSSMSFKCHANSCKLCLFLEIVGLRIENKQKKLKETVLTMCSQICKKKKGLIRFFLNTLKKCVLSSFKGRLKKNGKLSTFYG